MTANQYSWLQHYCLNFSAVPNYNRHTLLHPPVCMCCGERFVPQKNTTTILLRFFNSRFYCLFYVSPKFPSQTLSSFTPASTIRMCVSTSYSSCSDSILCVPQSMSFIWRGFSVPTEIFYTHKSMMTSCKKKNALNWYLLIYFFVCLIGSVWFGLVWFRNVEYQLNYLSKRKSPDKN